MLYKLIIVVYIDCYVLHITEIVALLYVYNIYICLWYLICLYKLIMVGYKVRYALHITEIVALLYVYNINVYDI